MRILTIKERQQRRAEITRKRVNTLIAPLMQELGIDMWVVPSGDFRVDPVFPHLMEADAPVDAIAVLSLCGGKFEKFLSGSHMEFDENSLYQGFTNPGEDKWAALARLITEKQPRSIAVDCSAEFSILDGISHTDYEAVCAAAGEIPVVSAEALAMRFMQHRTAEELENYEVCAALSRQLIRETFSRAVVTPGVTTTDDVRWFMRQWMIDRGLGYTWGPNCDVQRRGCENPMLGGEDAVEVIQPGDLVHIDFGISYLQCETDMQYLCYVLKDGETEAPQGLRDGFAACRKHQQIYMDTVRPGVTGNELWREINEKSAAAGLKSMVYSHPIGFHVHGVGASIGRFGRQPDIPHGVYQLENNMCFAMEQNVRVKIPEWDDQEIFIFREEDVALLDGKIRVIGELQPELFTI